MKNVSVKYNLDGEKKNVMMDKVVFGMLSKISEELGTDLGKTLVDILTGYGVRNYDDIEDIAVIEQISPSDLVRYMVIKRYYDS